MEVLPSSPCGHFLNWAAAAMNTKCPLRPEVQTRTEREEGEPGFLFQKEVGGMGDVGQTTPFQSLRYGEVAGRRLRESLKAQSTCLTKGNNAV